MDERREKDYEKIKKIVDEVVLTLKNIKEGKKLPSTATKTLVEYSFGDEEEKREKRGGREV